MTLCIVLTAIAIVASPAFAEVQNVKVSGDVDSAGVYRSNYDLLNTTNSNRSAGDNDKDNFLITQARIRVDADLTDNVMATIRLLTEYDWNTEDNTGGRGASAADGDNVDLDLACVTIKEAFYSPLTVIVGRQPLRYGTAFIVGDPDTNGTSADTTTFSATDLSLRKSFDAVRAILDYNPWTVDLIFAKIDESNSAADDETLYGVNAAYEFDQYDAEAEAYWFLNRDDREVSWGRDGGAVIADATSPGHEIHTFGVRGSVAPAENLNLLGELAIQRGDFDHHNATTKRDQDATAWQVGADYTFSEITWEPIVRFGYTSYSGEGKDDLDDQSAWIPLYEDQTHGVVANYILAGINGGQDSNAEILNIGATAEPIEDLTVSIDYYKFWLDEKLQTTSDTAPVAADRLDWVNLTEGNYLMNADDDLGYEVDLALNYDYTEDVKMGLSAGWFVPGKALEGSNSTNQNDETALQVLATLDVAF